MPGTFLTGDGGGTSPSQERLLARSVVGSPFRDDPVTKADVSTVVACPEDGCGRRYLDENFLAKHIATHSVRPEDAERELAKARRRRAYRARAEAKE